ncbi:restriction endonuclease subunit S [Listeria aquatica]|uniref:restriction endonuclease subunit S n=1 Tax=Listeria aquatica TaxID=1494960 RepID=UPI003EFAD189
MNRKVPEIRFEGFTEDWVLREFLEVVTRVTTMSNSNLLPKVEFQDIIAGEGRLNKDVNDKFDDRKGVVFKAGNILYGKLRPYLKNWLFPDFDGIALGDFWVFEAKNSAPIFVYSLIQSDNFQKVANDTSGTKMPRSDWKKVSNTMFSIPDVGEQKKIGSFFRELDNLIALHQRKLENLKKSKKGFLQKMFPKNGEQVPEIRFANHKIEWSEYKLGELGETYTGLSGKTKVDFGHGDARFVTYVNVFKNPITDLNGIEKVEIDSKQNQVQYGDIFFTTSSETSNEVGMSSIWLGNNQNMYLNSFCFGYRPFQKNYPFYFAFMLRSQEVRKRIVFLAQGISRYNISKNKMMEIGVPLPSYKEQTQIGNFLKKIDDTIALQERQLENLKKTKQAFLQKMFI